MSGKSQIKKMQCDDCNGSGFVKKIPIVCDICNGIKCINCKESGLIQRPYDLCNKCDSCGEIEVNHTK